MSHEDAPSRDRQGCFPATRWSIVLAATRGPSPSSAEALEAICRDYWYPLYAYVRRSGRSEADAQDLTQGFFARLLEKRWLDSADREKGRLRTFLVVALKNFMNKEWRRASAQKRGGHLAHVPFDTKLGETLYASNPSAELEPEHAFDREWALKLLELTVKRLEAEYSQLGKSGVFDQLKDCLTADRGSIDYGVLAARLELSEGAARVAVHRMRKRFREIYRQEISQTLAASADLDDEMRHLATALANP